MQQTYRYRLETALLLNLCLINVESVKGCQKRKSNSRCLAAQFQLDLTALQLLGPVIYNMYQALCIVHQGSEAYAGEETVLHYAIKDVTSADAENDQSVVESTEPVIATNSGIAWDDAMRCLGSSFPTIRLRLEIMWWLEIHGSLAPSAASSKKKSASSELISSTDEEPVEVAAEINSSRDAKEQGGASFLTPEYANNKRLVLGPVDFFRLFVPWLPETAIPEGESSRYRIEQMLRWRKRVARASVLVRAYARARTVANRGWNLGMNVRLPDNYRKRRVAYDDNLDNKQRDSLAKNEYYEATVSRDVIVQVRGVEYLKSQSWWKFGLDAAPPAMSLYQGYTLVGIHAFQWPRDDEDLPLHYKKDPVQSISSLRAVIDSNPELDFFVNAFFQEAQNAAIINVYVRSLPKGIDPKFDTVVSCRHSCAPGD